MCWEGLKVTASIIVLLSKMVSDESHVVQTGYETALGFRTQLWLCATRQLHDRAAVSDPMERISS